MPASALLDPRIGRAPDCRRVLSDAGYFTCKSGLRALPPSPCALAGRLRRAQIFVPTLGIEIAARGG
jgi:hypothetical protein